MNVMTKSFWSSWGKVITSLTCISRQLIDTCGINSQILMDFLVYELNGFPEVTHMMNNCCQTTAQKNWTFLLSNFIFLGFCVCVLGGGDLVIVI